MAAAALIASVAFGAMSTMAQNKGEAQAASAQVRELERQKKREREIGREQKSDIARAEDQAIGELIAAQSDTGATSVSIARLVGEQAGISGLDIARTESNVIEANRARRADQISVIKGTQNKILVNTLSFFGDTAGSIASFKSPKKVTPKSRDVDTGPEA